MKRLLSGMRSYLSLLPSLDLMDWRGSFSTNIQVGAGGWKGRSLKKGDILNYTQSLSYGGMLQGRDFVILPWKPGNLERNTSVRYLIGCEWNWLTLDAKLNFEESIFQVSSDADRMGYRLTGRGIELKKNIQLISSAVSFGTIQLLPNGNLIVLMADHQTTGGYPRIANVITADLPLVAQKRPNDFLQFKLTDLATAEHTLIEQEKYLHYLRDASKFKIGNLVHVSM
ncbi:MAG: hypothetical protein NVS1B13_00690 [Flavisolibacter sp.]